MVNVTEIFLKEIKKLLKKKCLCVSDYVVCIVCKDNKLEFLIVPLTAFGNNEEKLPFRSFVLYKKSGLWLSCNIDAQFLLINKRISFNKKGEVILLKSSEYSRNSIGNFTAKCLSEHRKNEKLTKKDLARNLKMTIGKLNSILSGSLKHIDIEGLINMSYEFQGKNKISGQYFVMVEKYSPNKKTRENIEEF